MLWLQGDIELQTSSPDRPGFKSNPKDGVRNPPSRMRISGGVGGEYKYSGISPAVEYGDSGEEDLEEEYKREKKDQTLSSGRLILYLILPLLFMTCPLFHYCILSYPILSCPFYHYCILSYPILSFLLFHYCILSYPIPSLPLLHSILSYPVLSTIIAFYPILSCPVIF